MVVLIATPFCNEQLSFVNAVQKKKTTIMCANCGGYGHLYKSCNHPVISYGVICYQLVYDDVAQTFYPKFLMVQRKDSLSYVEFIRGKYNLENRSYLLKLFSNMTDDERTRISQNTFEMLWKSMWCKSTNEETNKNFTKEYLEAAEKFALLKKGYLLKTEDGSIIKCDLDYILDNTESTYNETEWGFPKGRRNINEDDISCALREFKEESGLYLKHIRLLNDVKPIEEVFSGSNKVRYKHVYYLARYHAECDTNVVARTYCREIKDAQWFTYDEMIHHIRPYNVERRELAKRVMNIISKKLHAYDKNSNVK
jgi:8-oxo-dGTP pyrophosphatase MutT (NUDIX family)